MKCGYVRVSTVHQDLEGQIQVLKSEGAKSLDHRMKIVSILYNESRVGRNKGVLFLPIGSWVWLNC